MTDKSIDITAPVRPEPQWATVKDAVRLRLTGVVSEWLYIVPPIPVAHLLRRRFALVGLAKWVAGGEHGVELSEEVLADIRTMVDQEMARVTSASRGES